MTEMGYDSQTASTRGWEGADAPKRISEIENELTHAEKLGAVLTDTAGTLFARLQSVLGPDTPHAVAPKEGDDPLRSSLASRIAGIARSMESTNGVLISLVSRLEL